MKDTFDQTTSESDQDDDATAVKGDETSDPVNGETTDGLHDDSGTEETGDDEAPKDGDVDDEDKQMSAKDYENTGDDDHYRDDHHDDDHHGDDHHGDDHHDDDHHGDDHHGDDHHGDDHHGDDDDDDDHHPPCFTPGTMILTATGGRPIETLKPGDKGVTRDNGLQEIRWVGTKVLDGRKLLESPHLRPILIRKGALGRGLPERDMMVSPNHRMLIANDKTTLLFEDREVLVAAKHLVNGTSIQQVDSIGLSYIHMMFDTHEIVLGDGAWTESFQPGDYSLKGIGDAQRNEIFELFPELRETHGRKKYVSARRSLKRNEARLLN